MKIKLLCFFSLLLPLLLNANVTIGKWRVFFAPKDKLTAEQVCNASRNGILPAGAVEFTLKNNLRNLKDIRGYYHFGKEAALVHTTITAREKCKVRIGTGCDWFMSVFCNGKMVMSNEPDGSTVYTSHTEMDYQLTLDLNAGTNHLSFRLRPGSASWDFAFALAPSPANWPKETDGRRGFFQRLFPDAERTFYIFPYISDITPDSVRLSMEFSDEEAVQLRYRKMGSNKWLLHAPELREGLISRKKLHHFELKNLVPASRYECIIEVLAQKYGAKPVEIQRCVFNTLPDRGMKHSVIITGDTQVRPYICREAVIATCKTAPDAAMFIHLGDVQHSIKNPVRDFFRNIVDAVNVNYAEKIKNNPETPLLPAILLRGNHDFRGKYSEYYTRYFRKAYRAFRIGDVFYIILDTGEMIPECRQKNAVTYYNDFTEYFKQQRKWLEEVIASPECRTAKRRIVLAHATPLANEKHFRKSIEKITGNAFFGENPKCKIDLWIAGHVHTAYRYHPANNTLHGLNVPWLRHLLNPEKQFLKGINFPFYVNDGPGGEITLSSLELKHDPDGMEIICRDIPSGKVLDHVRLEDNKPFIVKKSVFVEHKW
ncbi:MAG: metallophosphoesterase [Lentisphaeria bacterium]|nr:metallophosphoesterase [Lentisphaeria bacterium]